MNSAIIAFLGLVAFATAFRFYSVFLARKVFTEEGSFITPAHELEDGMDFVPAPRHVLFGHHFTSVAGAAPIVGPAIAVIWGWLPAFLWVVLGTIFIGAMHDYGCLMISAKNKGRSIGDLAATVLSRRARLIFLTLVVFLAWIVLAVFAYVIALLFVQHPETVLPVNIQILCAPVIGYLAYKKRVSLLAPSLVVLVLLYFAVWVGTRFPISLPNTLGLEPINIWILFLLAYSFIASILPVWLLLQPRDLINSHQLFLGLGAMYVGLFIVHPDMVAPALRLDVADGPPWFPFLFITIACGAISGFHGLVSSGTTSKQLDTLPDARYVGFGGMLGEGCLALMSVLACTAGFAHADAWHAHYQNWSGAQGLGAKIGAFVEGGGYFLIQGLGVPMDYAQALIAVIVICFAATTLDTATRIQRLIISELGVAYRISPLQNRFVAAGIAAFSPLILVYGGRWQALWPLFGATNQMLGGLSLIVIATYLYLKKRPVIAIVVPMLFITIMTCGSMIFGIQDFIRKGDHLLTGLSSLLLILSLAMLFEGFTVAFARARPDGVSAPPLDLE